MKKEKATIIRVELTEYQDLYTGDFRCYRELLVIYKSGRTRTFAHINRDMSDIPEKVSDFILEASAYKVSGPYPSMFDDSARFIVHKWG